MSIFKITKPLVKNHSICLSTSALYLTAKLIVFFFASWTTCLHPNSQPVQCVKKWGVKKVDQDHFSLSLQHYSRVITIFRHKKGGETERIQQFSCSIPTKIFWVKHSCNSGLVSSQEYAKKKLKLLLQKCITPPPERRRTKRDESLHFSTFHNSDE